MKSFKLAASAAALLAAAPAGVVGAPRMDAAGNVETMLKEIRQELGRVSDGVRQTAEDALKQAKDNGALTRETKETADKALNEFNGLSGALNKLEGKLEALETRNLDLEQAVAAGGRGGAGEVMSAGQELAASKELETYRANGLSGNLLLKPKAAITTATGSGGGLIWPTEDRAPANMPRQRLLIRALLMQASCESDVVHYAKQTTRTNNAAPVAEEGTAPESSYGWTKGVENVKKVAHVTHISEEALADAGQLEAAIDGELRYGLDLEEEAQILAGDGTGENLDGLVTQATAFSAAAGLPNATRIDRLRLAMLQLTLANYATTGMTLSPVDWAAIELLKDENKRYIFGNPSAAGSPVLWGADVIATPSHSAGEWMVGNFMMAATIYDRQAAEVLISSEHNTNFVDGMKTMKGTKRLAMAVKRPGALITGDFTFS